MLLEDLTAEQRRCNLCQRSNCEMRWVRRKCREYDFFLESPESLRSRANDRIAELTRERDEALKRVAELLDLLYECQFGDNSGGEYSPACPICARHPPYHDPDCALAKALKGGA